ncbi:MAG TPA: hypothetical protein VE077_12440 [Candidatus Methylomirabilis sp.]|nr:hypothetical protein [Candidatus Methylomirabilis sp.]
MYSAADFASWIVTALMESFACALIVLRGRLRRYQMLAFYFAGCALFDLAGAETLLRHGLGWVQHMTVYYYVDCCLTMLL